MKISAILSVPKRPRRQWTVVNATPHALKIRKSGDRKEYAEYPSALSLRCDYARGGLVDEPDGVPVTWLGKYTVVPVEGVEPGSLVVVSPVYAAELVGDAQSVTQERVHEVFGVRGVRVCTPDTNPDVVERDGDGQIAAAGGLIEYTDAKEAEREWQ